MKNKAKEIGSIVKERVQNAQKQFSGFEDEVQKFVSHVQEKFLNTPMESVKRVDDLLQAIAVRDFVEKVRAIEMFKQGAEVRKEILDRFGLVAEKDLEALRNELTQLRADVDTLSKKRPDVTKAAFDRLTRRVAKLDKAPAGEAKQTPAKKTTKKTTTK